MKFQISQNTDTVDIDDRCLGLSTMIDDRPSALNENRGLHIQIRHNCNSLTFDAACELSHLIKVAPELLDAVARVLGTLQNYNPEAPVSDLRELFEPLLADLLTKAKGR